MASGFKPILALGFVLFAACRCLALGPGNLIPPTVYWDANATAVGSGSDINGGGTGSWDDATSDWWAGGQSDAAWGSNCVACFGGKPGRVTLNAPESAGGLVFLMPGYCIRNVDGTSALTLVGRNPTIQIPAGTTTIGCDLAGGGSGTELTVSGAGTLILTEPNTFSGKIRIKSGTLDLASGGSVSQAASITLEEGAMLDVSAYSQYYVAAGTAFCASAGKIIGRIRIDGPVTLDYAGRPALNLAHGSMTLEGGSISVNNTSGRPLSLGAYALIQAPDGDIFNSATSVIVTGAGTAPGTSVSLAVRVHNLDLVVGPLTVSAPSISSVALSGNNLVFSGVNGFAGGTFHVLTSTNLSTPFSNWKVIMTDAFSQTGTFTVTNSNTINPSYFIIRVPQP